MGESSKTSGENGEKITEELLKLIGWSSPLKGVSVPCNSKSHDKKTHGNDFVFIYNNPLHENRTDIVYVSSKNVKKGYPKGDQGVKTAFKGHLSELDGIVSCSKVSGEIKQAIQTFQGRKQKKHVGLLVWLHGDRETQNRDIKPALSRIQLDLASNCPLYLVDMARASFIKEAISHFRASKQGEKYHFYYPKLGNVIANADERYGDLLPIELMASDLIPIRFTLGEKPSLCLYAKQSFSEESMKKLCSLAFDFADGWVQDIFIGLESYHPAEDKQTKDAVLMAYQDRKANIKVFCYKESILDLLEY
ncbi:hypothetical protein [Neopusillimonas maritima]|uniref:GAPS4 PD-(D/E)XK nuclease domain-containing protein n=1 Tax=Neopusillimonas maritima TaxID=2026239 RepID=A0A3A1YUZ9_9BURK|nr:hypothetical protein [Neopusillimonas maritima]RII83011.1 hypothetical protein CJO09_05195 [Neopusillimonas maritima]RIY41366.1 hypothetical protein CJP73_07500 [Neopusillimonas maritima]